MKDVRGKYLNRIEGDNQHEKINSISFEPQAVPVAYPCRGSLVFRVQPGMGSFSLGRTIIREIIEDSDTAFEMKITECLTEVVFRKADALDLGYACVCHADFGLPEGMDIDIKLIRTKTLMQGHDCCNHRYVLGG